MLALFIIALGGYCLGSIPTGYWIGRFRGIDIRRLGSGNIGATNVMRILGKPAGAFVLLIDALKGYFACTLLPWIVLGQLFQGTSTVNLDWIRLTGGIMAIVGHNYPCWLGFKGGKGIATSAGVLVALMPIALVVCLVVWLLVLALSRYVSLASIVAAAVLPFAVLATQGTGVWLAVSVLLSAMAIYKHRANIQRLYQGTEHKFGQKPSNPTK